METIIWLAVLAAAAYIVWKFVLPKADVNNDGKVDAADVTATVEKATTVLDVNKDGKVDKADAGAAVEKVAEKAKKNVAKAADKTAAKVKKTAEKTADAVVKKAGRPKKTA